MTSIQFSIHDNITEAIRHLQKAHDLIRIQSSYPCQSVDVNAVGAASEMLANLCDLLEDVDRSTVEHTTVSSIVSPA